MAKENMFILNKSKKIQTQWVNKLSEVEFDKDASSRRQLAVKYKGHVVTISCCKTADEQTLFKHYFSTVNRCPDFVFRDNISGPIPNRNCKHCKFGNNEING